MDGTTRPMVQCDKECALLPGSVCARGGVLKWLDIAPRGEGGGRGEGESYMKDGPMELSKQRDETESLHFSSIQFRWKLQEQ